MTFFQYNILPTGEIYYKPHLNTARIENKKNIKKLAHVAKDWNQLAEERKVQALTSWMLPDQTKNMAEDSELLTYIIKRELHKNKKKTKVYISYDDNKVIQGIAIASIDSRKGCKELKDLATHPKNIAIFSDDLPVRGVGTSLIVTVVKDVLKRKKGCKKLHLEAVKTAVPFYEKLGFEIDRKKKEHPNVVYMMLRSEQMKKLVSEHSDTVARQKNEPNIDRLKSQK